MWRPTPLRLRPSGSFGILSVCANACGSKFCLQASFSSSTCWWLGVNIDVSRWARRPDHTPRGLTRVLVRSKLVYVLPGPLSYTAGLRRLLTPQHGRPRTTTLFASSGPMALLASMQSGVLPSLCCSQRRRRSQAADCPSHPNSDTVLRTFETLKRPVPMTAAPLPQRHQVICPRSPRSI